MRKYVSTFIKYPEMETLKTCEYEEYDFIFRHTSGHESTFFETIPPKEFIMEIRVSRMIADDGSLLAETHLLHNVYNLNTLEEIKKL